MEAHLRAGVAIYNAGNYHAAHDAWEDHWLDLESGTDDELFLHGLIQFTAAVYHATERNWGGATGLAESAGEYLADLPATYRGVDLDTVRSSLATLHADPEVVERRAPPKLTHEGIAVSLADLSFEESTVAAAVYAEELGFDEEIVEQAITYAEADLETGDETSEFVTFVMDFARSAEREVVYWRLTDHVERRQQKEADVEGLFD
jgi:hypothetical protein